MFFRRVVVGNGNNPEGNIRWQFNNLVLVKDIQELVLLILMKIDKLDHLIVDIYVIGTNYLLVTSIVFP